MTDHRSHDKTDHDKTAAELDHTEGPDIEASKHVAGGEAAPASDQVARLQAEKEDLTQTLIRRQADFENYRKRVERDRQEEHRRGVGRLIEDLLPVLDALDRALKAYSGPQFEEYRKGLELVYRQTWDVLSRHGLERIPAEGKPFDPHFHQAIEQVETSEHPDDTVVEVVQDGFLYHGRVLRPSAVRVAVHVDARHSAAEGRRH